VYVHRDSRGRGVGRSLLAAIIERARAAGLGVVLARIAEANEPSVRLCDYFGFGRIGTQRRCGEKFGRILGCGADGSAPRRRLTRERFRPARRRASAPGEKQ
jgi:L-amino acid N-acyltransferase YncA